MEHGPKRTRLSSPNDEPAAHPPEDREPLLDNRPPNDRRTIDDHLMIRMQSGERSAFDEIVSRHQGELYGFFLKNLRDAALAEDLSQETLLKIYLVAWDYLPLGRFRPWMFRIARNLLIDTVRKQSHDALIHSIRTNIAPDGTHQDIVNLLPDDITTAELRARQSELSDIVDNLLQLLPADQRTTFTLHHFHNLQLSDIAEAMETNVSTTKSRLRLAREKLQQLLAREGVHSPDDA